MSVYNLAFDFVMQTNRSIFITGKAGTGKTTFLHRLREGAYKQMAVVAPTGVAAINAGGVTMHSFFPLPFGPFVPTEEGRRDFLSKQRISRQRRNVLRELELLVIDEISMVRADLLDAMDTVLRSVRRRHNEPFGGVQVVFIGDMYQLSPVARDEEWSLLSRYYEGIYFFYSHVLRERPPVYIEFDTIFRQSDSRFIELLNQVRNDRLTTEGYELLQSRYDPNYRSGGDDDGIVLTTHNYKADAINREELERIEAESFELEAVVKGEFGEGAFPTEKVLELKVGARVMFVKNDTETPRRFYNGLLGTVSLYDEKKNVVYVLPSGGDDEPIAVEVAEWENIRYSTEKDSLLIKEEVVGSFRQFPLRLAWAVTIHKSQGLTFDRAVIDAGDSFAPGQVYVALSRCRSLEGITLLSPINSFTIRNDEKVVRFSEGQADVGMLPAELDSSRVMFQLELLQGLFDFAPLTVSSKIWYKSTQEDEASFVDVPFSFISDIIDRFVEMEAVGRKFIGQLRRLMLDGEMNEGHVSERLQAAVAYFSPLMEEVVRLLKKCDASTDNRAVATEFDGFVTDLFSVLSQKGYMMQGVVEDFSIEHFFELRRKFVLPAFKFTSYSRTKVADKVLDVEHGDLLTELINVRNRLADEGSVPVYIIAPLKTIREMAHYLPLDEKEMMKINGMGKVRFAKYGAHFLLAIRDYCAMNNLRSQMSDLF